MREIKYFYQHKKTGEIFNVTALYNYGVINKEFDKKINEKDESCFYEIHVDGRLMYSTREDNA